MAIKPGDCVIRIKDLVIGKKMVADPWGGRRFEVDEYEKFWENFSQHVIDSTKKIDTKNWKDWSVPPETWVYEQELAKFGATHKETKRHSDRYVKFKTHEDLTMFVLRWS